MRVLIADAFEDSGLAALSAAGNRLRADEAGLEEIERGPVEDHAGDAARALEDQRGPLR